MFFTFRKYQENEKYGTFFVRLKSIDDDKCDEIVIELNDQVIPEIEKNNKLIAKKLLKRKLNQEYNENSRENYRIKEFKKTQNEVDELKEACRCAICLEKEKVILFLPCAHLASCLECSVSIKNCPICRKYIEASIRTYL
jgi:baculoviral IAP repeat-containing protein 2/3